MPKGAQIVDGPVEARKAAREQLDHGADWIKVYMTHRSWVGKNGELVSQPTLTVEELQAIVDETHGWGKKVACHAYGGIGLQRALDGGCDSIEHGLDLDDAAIAQMLKQGTWYVPTLSVYYTDWAPADTPAGQRDRLRASAHEVSFKKALKAGVKIVFGTDMGGIPWTEPIAQEFPRMVEFGMQPMDAIQAATSRAAVMLDMDGQDRRGGSGRVCRHHRGERRPAARHQGTRKRPIRDERRQGLSGEVGVSEYGPAGFPKGTTPDVFSQIPLTSALP